MLADENSKNRIGGQSDRVATKSVKPSSENKVLWCNPIGKQLNK